MKETYRKLTELKMRLISATDFYAVFNYFFDHFGENEEFIDKSIPRHNSKLQHVLIASVEPVLQQRTILARKVMMFYVPHEKFYHGAAIFNGVLTNFFYFQEIDAGLIALSLDAMTGKTVIIRFSFQMVGEPPKASRN
jgi:hypothetical protein